MSNLQYHSVEPESNRTQFKAFDTVDMIINNPRNLVKNSIRIEGVLSVFSTGSTSAVYSSNIGFNSRMGAHALLESVTTEVSGKIIENIAQDYGRFVNMTECATKSKDDYFSSAALCELKAPSFEATKAFAAGKCDETFQSNGTASTTQTLEAIDFSFKPVICLNRMSSDLEMSRVGGQVKVSFNLARNANFLVGEGDNGSANYQITELRLTYQSVDPSPIPSVMMRSVVSMKSLMNSSFANISSKVPAVCDGVSISFLTAARENQKQVDCNALESPPNVQEVQYLFNDSTNQYVQYAVDDYGEMQMDFLESLRSAGYSNVCPDSLKGSSAMGLGLHFGQQVDLSRDKFSVQVKSDVSASNSFLMYLYFHSLIEL
tara:strand:- start:1366 stop:2490 length:1125 start_codon:yes stop_codon:yes gene_type:complete